MHNSKELGDIYREALDIFRRTTVFMKELYPLNNVEFMNSEEKKTFNRFESKISSLHTKYLALYNEIPQSERVFIRNPNIMDEFNAIIHNLPSLCSLSNVHDESDIEKVFKNNLVIAKTMITRKISSERDNDKEMLDKCKRVLDCCNRVYMCNPMGASYLDYMVKYEERIRSGRTNEDDISDYDKLVEEAKNLAIEYARALINGAIATDFMIYDQAFGVIYERGHTLLRFLPEKTIQRMNLKDIFAIRETVTKNPMKYLTDRGIPIIQK